MPHASPAWLFTGALALGACAAPPPPRHVPDRPTVYQVVDDSTTVAVSREEETDEATLTPASALATEAADYGPRSAAELDERPSPEPAPVQASEPPSAGCLPSGVRVQSAETKDGVRIDFTAGADSVAGLRRRVAELVDRHNASLAAASQSKLPPLTQVRSTAAAANVPGGASVILKPLDASDAGTLRESVAATVQGIGSGELCPF